jgi:hypothetical protein
MIAAKLSCNGVCVCVRTLALWKRSNKTRKGGNKSRGWGADRERERKGEAGLQEKKKKDTIDTMRSSKDRRPVLTRLLQPAHGGCL